MRFQLVVRVDASTIKDYDKLVRLEDALIAALTPHSEAKVDGHDFGRGGLNIFIHTNEPRALLDNIGPIIQNFDPELSFSAGYRSFEDDRYIPLWPEYLESFEIA